MNKVVLNKTKLQLDDDFNIIDLEVEARKQKRKSEILDSISELSSRKGWLLDEVGELESEMNELEVEFKSL